MSDSSSNEPGKQPSPLLTRKVPAFIGAQQEAPSPQTASAPKPFRKTGFLGYLFLVVAVCLAFGSLFQSELIWTPYDEVTRSAYTEMDSWTDAWRIQSIKANDPLSITSYFLETHSPFPPHITHRAINLLLHLTAAFLLLKVINRLQFPAALGATLLFALHPATVQTIFWPGYRSELIGLIFILAALYFASGEVNRRDVLLFSLVGLLAALVPPAGLALPFILAGMILFRNRYVNLQSFNPILPLLFACLFLSLWIEPATPDFPESTSTSQRMYLLGQSIYFYIRQELLPVQLD